MPSEKIESQIEKDLRAHRPINQIKKAYGVGSTTIYKVMDRAGIPRERKEHSQTKNANKARSEFCQEKRLALIDAGMKKLEEMLPGVDKPSGMRDWFVALGTAIDKRRLEDPAGNKSETELLEKFVSELDNHADAISTKASPGLEQSTEN